MNRPFAIIPCASILLLSVVTGCGKKEATIAPSPVSVEALAQQTTQRLLAQPDVKQVLEKHAQGTPEATLDQLARRGWKRLSDDHLFQRISLRRKLLSLTDVTTCAAVVRDQAIPAQTYAALAKLDATDVQAFFTLKETAVLAEAKEQKPSKMVLQDEFPEAFGTLLKSLPAEQADHLGELLTGDPTQAADEDICWAEKTFLDALLMTPEPQRSILARAVVQ